MNKHTAVVLFQLGGPDSLEAVEPFLYNLFYDPDIIDLPGAFLFRKTLARFVSSRRAPKVQNLYRNIGGKSPILEETQRQAAGLQKSLERKGLNTTTHIAMRYWHPLTDKVVQKLHSNGAQDVVLLPLYPHYSKATTGSSFNEWNRALKRFGYHPTSIKKVDHYYDHPLYIEAMVEQINLALSRIPKSEQGKAHFVFSAHGIPLSLVRAGDPYPNQIKRTYELIVERGKWNLPHHLCFQSKVGPQKWLEPSLTQTIHDLAIADATHLVVVPIAFVTEHIETLSEINIEAREEAQHLGVQRFEMMPALIDNKKFIECLTDLVTKQVRT
ncbi:MAG: ferrochelatase [Ignavibacteriae bacterium]|nr:ferrochelatase [Ignavibacteriota bacterium]